MDKLGFLWKDRQSFPDVVVPLADAPAPAYSDPNAETKPNPDAKANLNRLDSASSQEKGTSPVPPSGVLTLEGLRAEVESAVAASGVDSVYDRRCNWSWARPCSGLPFLNYPDRKPLLRP